MTQQSRDYLKQEFQDGERPSGGDFADLVDSFVNKKDDGIQVENDGSLVLAGGLLLGPQASPKPGMLRLSGASVQISDGTSWTPLGAGGGVFQAIDGGSDVAYGDGNVGIGQFAAAPTFRFEVDLGANTGEGERVRFGNATVSSGSGAFSNDAIFSHRNHGTSDSYALRQSRNGDVDLNAPDNQRLRLNQGGNNVRLLVSDSGNVIVNKSRDLNGANGAKLQVEGDAYVNGDFTVSGSGPWTPSDLRVKEDVRDFEAGLLELARVRPVQFRYNGKAGTPAGKRSVGIIGQEMEPIFPDMIRRVPTAPEQGLEGNDVLNYDGSSLTYVLVNAVKELAAKVESLEAALANQSPVHNTQQ